MTLTADGRGRLEARDERNPVRDRLSLRNYAVNVNPLNLFHLTHMEKAKKYFCAGRGSLSVTKTTLSMFMLKSSSAPRARAFDFRLTSTSAGRDEQRFR